MSTLAKPLKFDSAMIERDGPRVKIALFRGVDSPNLVGVLQTDEDGAEKLRRALASPMKVA